MNNLQQVQYLDVAEGSASLCLDLLGHCKDYTAAYFEKHEVKAVYKAVG
jgi:hypothetical protein